MISIWEPFEDADMDALWELMLVTLQHNPYNIRVHLESLFGLSDTLSKGEYITREQEMAMFATAFYHVPIVVIHAGVRLGVVPAVSGGFGYFKSLVPFPMLQLSLGYQQLGFTVAEMPATVLQYTSGTGGAYKPPGSNHWSFRNPISGM